MNEINDLSGEFTDDFLHAQADDRDEQTRVAALAEVRALQARMNPHFLFNALNALCALSRVAPREVPRATGRLRQFLRASFEQQERVLVPVEEELAVVRAYLDIESLRLGDRLKVEQSCSGARFSWRCGAGLERALRSQCAFPSESGSELT